jgi:hypothetical protein
MQAGYHSTALGAAPARAVSGSDLGQAANVPCAAQSRAAFHCNPARSFYTAAKIRSIERRLNVPDNGKAAFG